jgi:hypothetical protein
MVGNVARPIQQRDPGWVKRITDTGMHVVACTAQYSRNRRSSLQRPGALKAAQAGLAVFAAFCSDLSASDTSSTAEILDRRWLGALKNSQVTSFYGCYSLFAA